MSFTQVQQTGIIHMTLSNPPPQSPAISSRRNQKIRLDPIRALEPARKKLSTVESQRVMCVLEESKKRCDLISILPQVLKHLDRYSSVLGPELTALLNEHKSFHDNYVSLDKQHTDLMLKASNADGIAEDGGIDQATGILPTPPASRPISRNLSSRDSHFRLPIENIPADIGPHIEEIVIKIKMIELEISLSLKGVMRAFSLNPGAVRMLMHEVGKEKSREGTHFSNQLIEMREILMEKLLMTPAEVNEKMRYLSQVSAEERQNAAIIEQLETELAAANAQKDKEITVKNDIVRKLMNDLHMLKKSTDEEIKRTKTEADKQEAADNKNSEGKRQKLLDDLNELKARLQNLSSEHREVEQELRRLKWKVETEVDNWIQRYDGDMGEKQDEYEEIDAIYTEEKKQLNELDERFKTLEAEYKQITDAKNKAKDEREAAERQLALMIRCATTIQAVWRSYKVRKALKAKNKGKGKKGKK